MSGEVGEHFFVVGAQRCGTTYLYRVLDEHPEVTMARPVTPEPKFFLDDEQYQRGLDWYRSHYFGDAVTRLLGEKSASYLESEVAARRIAGAFPEARIVVMLREPVARAVSNYWYSVQNGLEDLPLEKALRADEEHRARVDNGWYVVGAARVSASPFAYRRRGHYLDDLRRYVEHFGRDRVLVLIFEETVESLPEVQRVYRFLGADDGFVPPSLQRVINPGKRHRTPLPDDLRDELREHFDPHNAALADEFDLDLSSWQIPQR